MLLTLSLLAEFSLSPVRRAAILSRGDFLPDTVKVAVNEERAADFSAALEGTIRFYAL